MKHRPFADFGARLSSVMDTNTVTGKALAAILGVRESTVSQWRRGVTMPEDANLSALAAHLSVSPQWLRYGGAQSGRALGAPLPERATVADLSGVLQGRLIEVRALLAYALERQDELIALSGQRQRIDDSDTPEARARHLPLAQRAPAPPADAKTAVPKRKTAQR